MNDVPLPLERLAEAIKRQFELLGSFNRLGDETKVDRRKLKRLAESKDVPLTMRELSSLNEYLSMRGLGISAVFSPTGIVRQIADRGEVIFVLGSQPDQSHRRIDFSRWDIRSLRVILQAMNATGRAANFGIEDVIWREKAEDYFGPGKKVPENEAWYHHLVSDGPSIICIGSAKANHCCEVMLARMMGVDEFGDWPHGRAAPFFFTWADCDRRAQQSKSAFKRTSQQLAEYPGGTKELIERLRRADSPDCVLFDGEMREIFRTGEDWHSYAVVAAQRRPGNQFWVVLAGATGPATLGAAEEIQNFVADLPLDPKTRCSKVVWAVVRVRVNQDHASSFRPDERCILAHNMFDQREYVGMD